MQQIQGKRATLCIFKLRCNIIACVVIPPKTNSHTVDISFLLCWSTRFTFFYAPFSLISFFLVSLVTQYLKLHLPLDKSSSRRSDLLPISIFNSIIQGVVHQIVIFCWRQRRRACVDTIVSLTATVR